LLTFGGGRCFFSTCRLSHLTDLNKQASASFTISAAIGPSLGRYSDRFNRPMNQMPASRKLFESCDVYCRKYVAERTTEKLSVRYFVKSDFLSYYADSIGQIERQVEEEYLHNLQQNCYREKAHREYSDVERWGCYAYSGQNRFQIVPSYMLQSPTCTHELITPKQRHGTLPKS